MHRIGWFAIGLWAVLVVTTGCSATTGGGGSGGMGGIGGGGGSGAGGTGGQGGGMREPCASLWEAPPGQPIQSAECTYDFPGAGAPSRDCAYQDGTRIEFAYDNTRPCGIPCITGRPLGSAAGNHFDAALLPRTEARTVASGGDQLSRIEYTLDNDGNEIEARTYDAADQLTGTAITTYVQTNPPPALETQFETRIQGSGMLITLGTVRLNASGQLVSYEVFPQIGFNPGSLFTYAYNGDGSLDQVVWDNDEPKHVGDFDFAYGPATATVTLELDDMTTQSVLTFDYVCAP